MKLWNKFQGMNFFSGMKKYLLGMKKNWLLKISNFENFQFHTLGYKNIGCFFLMSQLSWKLWWTLLPLRLENYGERFCFADHVHRLSFYPRHYSAQTVDKSHWRLSTTVEWGEMIWKYIQFWVWERNKTVKANISLSWSAFDTAIIQ